MVKIKDEREVEILSAVVDVIKKHIDPPRIFLFGSRAKRNNGEHSDFDIAVDSREPGIMVKEKVEEEMAEVLGLYKMDILYLGSVAEELKKNIIETGRVIYERGT
jgi:CRISPR-associated protein Cmr1